MGQQVSAEQSAVPATIVQSDLVLQPGVSYGRLIVAASDITIDGNGIVLQNSLLDAAVPANKRRLVGISSNGHHNVVLKNIIAKGWETGLEIHDGKGWTIDNCDFSDNFHDPEFGWGENGRRGGIVLENVTDSTIRNCKANRVWDACVLVDSHRNVIEANDFSHTSNTCLKLWHASENIVRGNNFSYGIRIKPNEVHARDSTGVLIESGSNRNRFEGNDCTHGGDGIFVRVLNGWCSVENVFMDNDCSYANNNGFECWAPRNTFIRNKANHCSYGFWLGGSDQTRLIENEASFNGLPTGNHNSPHLPDQSHAGIVFMFGPSSHVLARGNRCVGNHGAGIALIGDQGSKGEKWKAYHWVLEGNELQENRWGIFVQYADWVTLANNVFINNAVEDVRADLGVSRLLRSQMDSSNRISKTSNATDAGPTVIAPKSVVVDQETTFDVELEGNEFLWDFGDGTISRTRRATHAFASPGFYRVGVTVIAGDRIDLGYRDLYVVSGNDEWANDPQQWTFVPDSILECTFSHDPNNSVVGDGATRVDVNPYHGGIARILFPRSKNARIASNGKKTLRFWWKATNPNMPGWQSNNPEITLHQDEERLLRLIPVRDLLKDPVYNEAREGWRYFEVPLRENSDWQREGTLPDTIEYVTIGFDSWGGDPLQIWIDGLTIE
jgi:parallel beta-helix repeat protein